MIQWEQIRAKNQGKLANQIHERQDQKFTRCNISKPNTAKPNPAKGRLQKKKKKKWFLSLWGLTPPLKSVNQFFGN